MVEPTPSPDGETITVFCIQCGTNLIDDSVFCRTCGLRVGSKSTAVATLAETEPADAATPPQSGDLDTPFWSRYPLFAVPVALSILIGWSLLDLVRNALVAVGLALMLVSMGYIGLQLYFRRHEVLRRSKRLVIAAPLYVFLIWVLISNHTDPMTAIIVATVFATIASLYLVKPRKRRIPNHVRTAVIGKWKRKTGLLFDPAVHELDHIIPFACGGGHTVENLRVVVRSVNRQKGKQRPWWDAYTAPALITLAFGALLFWLGQQQPASVAPVAPTHQLSVR